MVNHYYYYHQLDQILLNNKITATSLLVNNYYYYQIRLDSTINEISHKPKENIWVAYFHSKITVHINLCDISAVSAVQQKHIFEDFTVKSFHYVNTEQRSGICLQTSLWLLQRGAKGHIDSFFYVSSLFSVFSFYNMYILNNSVFESFFSVLKQIDSKCRDVYGRSSVVQVIMFFHRFFMNIYRCVCIGLF